MALKCAEELRKVQKDSLRVKQTADILSQIKNKRNKHCLVN